MNRALRLFEGINLELKSSKASDVVALLEGQHILWAAVTKEGPTHDKDNVAKSVNEDVVGNPDHNARTVHFGVGKLTVPGLASRRHPSYLLRESILTR
ncbi:hypothetical protein RIF29_19058 [Crotalaria pallida]|uniref:Uncharacterized protein n=1 Tax=Crotalaria pallida TaxID=3830 RepID=A0AAN9EYV9_CROPI